MLPGGVLKNEHSSDKWSGGRGAGRRVRIKV